jgi:murein DD-endopeptidase MepM/ murein hydrolase activator NlpD
MIPGVRILILFGLLFNSLSFGQTDKNLFIPPLKIPISLSANFGELRADHFHSGVDIMTQGVTGKEVIASAEGYVYLILVSPGGFGKAIFIRHPSGYSTVYCHLDRYSPEIEEYVISQQYQNKSYAVTIYPPNNRFRIAQGQIIGYSGNTGGSSGPHLHFEVRKSEGEKPVNPLLFNFGIEDNMKPVFEHLAIYPASVNTTINGRNGNLYLNLTGADGNYFLPDDTELRINGPAGFGITSYDYMNNTAGRFGINSIELLIDSVPWFSYEINEFSFYETRYINAHIDYEAAKKNNVEIERTFVLPNDKLSLYKGLINNGLYDFGDNKSHIVTIIVQDGSNNKSVLSFNVKPAPPKTSISGEIKDTSFRIMPFGKSNFFVSDGVKVSIPSGALYDTLYFRYSKSYGNGKLLSDIHHIHDRFTPVQKAYSVSIKPDSIPPAKSSKLLITEIDDKMKQSAVGGTFSDGFITADVLSFGSFAVAADTVPPVISANGLSEDSDLTGKKDIRIKITDDLSGIKGYIGTIDGNWALFEYDAKNDLIFYKFDPQRIKKGTKHKLFLVVTDNRDNSSSLTREFTW